MKKNFYLLVLSGLLATSSAHLFSMTTPPHQPIKTPNQLVLEFDFQSAIATHCITRFPNPAYSREERHAYESASVKAINRVLELAQRIEDNGPIGRYTVKAYQLKTSYNEAFNRH